MKKIVKLFIALITVLSALVFVSPIKNAVAGTPTYEEADVLSVADLKISGKSVGGKYIISAPTTFTYDGEAEYGSVVLSFKYKIGNTWSNDNGGNQIHFFGKYQMNGFVWLRADKTYIGYTVGNDTKYASDTAMTKGDHQVEVGRLAIMDGTKFTGKHHIYVKVDGADVVSYDVSGITEEQYKSYSLFFTGSTGNTILDNNWDGNNIKFVVDGDIKSEYKSTADYIEKPDLTPSKQGYEFIGWFNDLGKEWDFENDMVTGDLTLTAGFKGASVANEQEYFSDENFTPVLRFMVTSDVHFHSTVTVRDSLLAQAFQVAYGYAENSSKYNNLDAALVAGDVADDGTEASLRHFKEVWDEAIQDGTVQLISMGNHDWRGNSTKCDEVFYDVIGQLDTHIVINGFHFIALSPNRNTGENFSQEKAEWLDAELAKAQADDPTKPIFVMQHEGIQGTIYGADAWGVNELTDVLVKYPQVVDFSGHSHYPLQDPRIIWQGTFTAIGTGTLHYYEVGINNYKIGGVFPTDKLGGWASSPNENSSYAEFQIVEVDANNNIRVIFYDLTTNKEIARYYIDNVMDNRKTKYSRDERAKDSEKPTFVDANIESSANENTITLSFNQATCKDIVESYRVELIENSNKTNYYILSDYFFDPTPERITYTMQYLKENTDYTIRVYAVNVWGDESETYIETKVKTGYVPTYEDVIDEISLYDLYASNGNSKLTTEAVNKYLQAYFKPSANNVYGSFKLRLQLLYLGGGLQICFNEDFANADLVWMNSDEGDGHNNIWFIKDNFKSAEPISQGLHEIEYGRYHITSGAHRGYTAFYVKLDGVMIHTLESDRAFTTNGRICLNFGSAYSAGSRYYDISYKVPTVSTPTFTDGADFNLETPITNWLELGGEVSFYSTSNSLEFWLEDKDGIATEKRIIEGTFQLGDKEPFYSYKVKTKEFTALTDDSNPITKICCGTKDWKVSGAQVTVYQQEVYAPYDELSILDIDLPNNTGILTKTDGEQAYGYEGTSETYSATLSYYLVTGKLNSASEFRTQLGTIWNYNATLWFQPGIYNICFYSWAYTTRPTDRYTVNLKDNTIYKVETGTILVAEGEFAGMKYTFLKIDDKLITGFYAPANECISENYQVALKIVNGYSVADISYGRTIEYVVDGKTIKTVKAINGMTTAEPSKPTLEGQFFCGWFTEDGKRVDFKEPVSSENETIKYIAQFSDTALDVNFYSEGELYENQKVGEGSKALVPNDPVKVGEYQYDFVKWVVKGTNEEFDFDSQITENIELEAVFKEHEYKIVYMVDGIEKEVRYFLESDPTTIIGGEPEVPSIKGATGSWVYSETRTNKDIYVSTIYDGTKTTASENIKLNAFAGAEVDIADDLTRYYLSFVDTEEQAKWLESYPVSGGHERQNITFSWSDSSANISWIAFFADNADFKNAFIVQTNKKSLDNVGIFTPGQTYYWKVMGADGTCSEVDTFKVLNTPVRWFSAGTVFNTRDTGGWTTTDGKQVKYGMIYRGGQLSLDSKTEKSYMDEYAFKVFSYLGIKTEIELRGDHPHDYNQINALETLILVNGTGYDTFFKLNDGHKEDYRAIFAALADESNYPFYYHCSWGADRTGSLGFIINAVLGVPYEQLVQDYELTSLSYSGLRARYAYDNGAFNNMYKKFMSDYSKGGTIQDAVYNWLTEFVGVPASDIAAMKALMLEDATEQAQTYVVTYKIDGEIYQQSKVFAGSTIKEIAPVFLDKHLQYWTLNGEEFDVATPVTSDLTLDAYFAPTTYEDYDVVTLRDINVQENWIPSATPYLTYDSISTNGDRMFVFNYKIWAADGSFDDGLHIELGNNTWNYKAHVWFMGTSKQHVFTDGDQPTTSLAYQFEYGVTYEIAVGVITPLEGENAHQKMFVITINDEIVCMLPTKADVSSTRMINFAGTEGILSSVENLMTATFIGSDGSVLDTQSVARGSLITAPNAPEQTNKVFLGWFDELGNEWNFKSGKLLRDTKLFAKYGDKTIDSVVLDENDVEILHGFKVKVGIKVNEVELPLVDDSILTFEGWYNGDKKLSDNDVISEDMKLICRFNIVETNNGGEDEPQPKEGCNGSIIAGLELVALLTVAGASLVALKKKKEF